MALYLMLLAYRGVHGSLSDHRSCGYKPAQTITLTPPCLTVGMRCMCSPGRGEKTHSPYWMACFMRTSNCRIRSHRGIWKCCSTDAVVKPSHCHLSHTSLICSAQGWCHRGAIRHHNHVCDVSFRRREPLAVHGNWESISSHSPAQIVYTQGHFHFTSSVFSP